MLKGIECNIDFFPGFYETGLLDDVLHDIEEEELPAGEEQALIHKVENRIARAFVIEFLYEIKPTLDVLGIYFVRYVGVDSPRFYNYRTDEVVCEFNVDLDKLNGFLEYYLMGHEELVKEVIEDKFTDRPGFTSFYSNDYTKWLSCKWEEIGRDGEFDNVILTTILSLIKLIDTESTQDELKEHFYNFCLEF